MTLYPLAQQTPPPSDAQSKKARGYVALLLAIILAAVVSLTALAWQSGPPVGDLGRISGLGSRDFGRQGSSEFYVETHFTRGPLQDATSGDVDADVLVFGDSFSGYMDRGLSWINEIYAQTGLRPYSVPLKDFKAPLAYLSSPEFLESPPQAIIIQSVERHLLERALEIYDPNVCPDPSLYTGSPLGIKQMAEPPREQRQAKARFKGLEDFLSWGATAAKTRVLGQDRALTVAMSPQKLFTHNRADKLLIYFRDLTEHTADAIAPLSPQEAASRAQCGLRRLVAAAGDVPIWITIAPDKRSVYAPWITTPLPEKVIDVSGIAQAALGDRYLNLYPVLNAAVSEGQKDLYWPDDTHWGANAHRLVGLYIAQQMKRLGTTQ